MDGEYEIKSKPEVTPFNLTTPSRIAFPLRNEVKEELEIMERWESSKEWTNLQTGVLPLSLFQKKTEKYKCAGKLQAAQREARRCSQKIT